MDSLIIIILCHCPEKKENKITPAHSVVFSGETVQLKCDSTVKVLWFHHSLITKPIFGVDQTLSFTASLQRSGQYFCFGGGKKFIKFISSAKVSVISEFLRWLDDKISHQF